MRKTIKRGILLIFLLISCLAGKSKGQSSKIEKESSDSTYLIIYEVIPDDSVCMEKCIRRIVFELPVSKDYFESVEVGMEVSSWFRTVGGSILWSNLDNEEENNNHGMWSMYIRVKKIFTKNGETEIKY